MLVRASGVPKSIGYLMGLSGLAYIAQGRVLGFEGFSVDNTAAILAGIVLVFSWSVWLLVTAWGSSDRRTPHVARREGERSSSPRVPLSVPERGDEERLSAPRASSWNHALASLRRLTLSPWRDSVTADRGSPPFLPMAKTSPGARSATRSNRRAAPSG